MLSASVIAWCNESFLNNLKKFPFLFFIDEGKMELGPVEYVVNIQQDNKSYWCRITIDRLFQLKISGFMFATNKFLITLHSLRKGKKRGGRIYSCFNTEDIRI